MSSISNIIIMGFGKMPSECAKVLIDNLMPIQYAFETEESNFSSLEGFCARNKILFKKMFPKEITQFLVSLHEQTVIFSINNNYIFPRGVCQKKNLRIINFHNSLLPRYPGHGLVVPTWAIFNGESRHGVTWHLVDETIDGGDILCQKEFEIYENDIALEVMIRAIYLGVDLFSKYWRLFLSEELTGKPQMRGNKRVYKRTDIPNNGLVNCSWDFMTMSRFLRSMDYGPFRLLPFPKIKIQSETYQIEHYEVLSEIKLDSQNVYSEEPPIMEVTKEFCFFYYKKGLIKLAIKRLHHET